MSAAQPPRGVRIFVSYAHEDDGLRAELRQHLSGLARTGLATVWDDRQIRPGSDWADEIDQRLNQAEVVLLLISPAFIASDYCYGKEMERALQRHDAADDPAIVVPVILRACDWQQHQRLVRLQALPREGKPLADWKDRDAYFTEVAVGLRKLVAEQRGERVEEQGGSGSAEVHRPPRWRRWLQRLRWQKIVALLALLVVAGGAAVWWSKARGEVEREMQAAATELRVGSYRAAHETLAAACRRPLVGARACRAAEAAKLGMLLEVPPEQLDAEAVGRGVAKLRAQPGGDQDATLLLFAAQLKLREREPELRAAAIDEAVRLLEQALALDPDLAEARYVLADLSLGRADYATALSALNKAVDSAPDTPHYRNARAYARWQLGDVRGAEADYRQSADSGALLSHLELAELLWRDGRFAAAADQQQAAYAALRDDKIPVRGRNHLPWAFDLQPGRQLVLRFAAEKRCYAQLAWQASRWLAGQTPPATVEAAATPADDCGALRSEIRAALAAALQRATLPPAAQARADALATALVSSK